MFTCRSVLVLVLLTTLSSCGDDAPPPVIEPAPIFEVDSTLLKFYDEDTGISLTQSFVISNAGDAPLVVGSMSLDSPGDAFVVEFPELPFQLLPGEMRATDVSFSPTSCYNNEGDIEIEATGTNERVFVYLRPDNLASEVLIEPDPLEFGRVVVGESVEATVELVNPGGCVEEILSLAVSGTTDIRFTGIEDNGEEVQLHTQTPLRIEAGGRLAVPVTYSPQNERLAFASFFVLSDHPREDVVTGLITGNGVADE